MTGDLGKRDACPLTGEGAESQPRAGAPEQPCRRALYSACGSDQGSITGRCCRRYRGRLARGGDPRHVDADGRRGVRDVLAHGPTGPELAVGAVGAAVLLAGLVRQSRRRVTVGAAGLLLGTVHVGLSGAPPSLALVGVTATVVAWDAAGTVIVLGDQLGRAADTACVEAVH